MEQLKNYITLLKCNCVTIAHQALEELHNSNRAFFFDEGNSIIFLDGDWWNDFITSHTLDVCKDALLHLRTRFKAKYLKLIKKDVTPSNFVWNDTYQMYIYLY